MHFVTAFYLLTLCFASPEQFYEILDCFDDSSEFICVNGVNNIIIWDIMRGRTLIYSKSFHQYNEIGTKYQQSVGSTNTTSGISSVNSTHITSTLMVTGHLLSEYSILCNNVIKEFNLLSPQENLLPTSLKIVPNEDIEGNSFNFTAFWNSSGIHTDVDYLISIYSTEYHSLVLHTVIESSTYFSLLINNTKYNINVSVCSNSSSTFYFGRCPFITSDQDIYLENYITDVSGAIQALLTDASNNQSFLLECSPTGEWNWTTGNSGTTTALLNITKTFKTEENLEKQNCSIFSMEVLQGGSIESIVTASIAATTFLVGVTVGVFGTSVIMMLVRRRERVRTTQHAIAPVYEEVNKAVKLSVSPNIAYEQVSEITVH